MKLLVKKLGNSNVWFTGDWHLYHNKIKELCGRPFKTTEQMNDIIISNHNSMVKDNDIVYMVGDTLAYNSNIEILNNLKGDIVYIRGNHDCKLIRKMAFTQAILQVNGYEIFITHKPQNIRRNIYTLNVVAHIHNKWLYNDELNAVNVGVDVWNFKPVSLESIMSFI